MNRAVTVSLAGMWRGSVPGADDIMLNYQSTSFHDAAYLRQVLNLRPAPEFEAWLQRMNVLNTSNHLLPIEPRHPLLESCDNL